MTDIVIDCSVTMAWCFREEADDYSKAVLESLYSSTGIVPAIWPLEVANVLLIAERRRRLTASDVLRFIDLLDDLSIIVDDETARRATKSILNVGRQHNLSAYDASYLELAVRRGLPLATPDRALRAAAERSGVSSFRA